MPYRPTPEHRRNVPGVVLPLTLAICNVYGIRAQDGARPIGAFYTEHVSRDRWVPLGGIWYQPVGEQEIFSSEELIELFSLDHVAKNPAVFDIDKLNWINSHYMKQLDVATLTDMALPHLKEAGLVGDELTEERLAWA